MAPVRPGFLLKTWTRDNYFISTNPTLIPVSKVAEFFATDDMHWAKAMPEEALAETIQNSLCFGLYEQTEPGNTAGQELIGFARCVTDFITLIYLTDVYTKPSHRGKKLGVWLISCVQETIDSMPYLRRSMLITSDWDRSVPFYQKLMGVSVMESRRLAQGESGDGTAVLSKTGPGWPDH